MENLNFHLTAKLNSCEICSNTRPAKFNSVKMQKFRGFCELRNFLPSKISDNKVNVLKFELQYEWTPPKIFFCGHRVSQLFCHNVEGAL